MLQHGLSPHHMALDHLGLWRNHSPNHLGLWRNHSPYNWICAVLSLSFTVLLLSSHCLSMSLCCPFTVFHCPCGVLSLPFDVSVLSFHCLSLSFCCPCSQIHRFIDRAQMVVSVATAAIVGAVGGPLIGVFGGAAAGGAAGVAVAAGVAAGVAVAGPENQLPLRLRYPHTYAATLRDQAQRWDGGERW